MSVALWKWQDWSSEVVAFFLEDWALARVALSCHVALGARGCLAALHKCTPELPGPPGQRVDPMTGDLLQEVATFSFRQEQLTVCSVSS